MFDGDVEQETKTLGVAICPSSQLVPLRPVKTVQARQRRPSNRFKSSPSDLLRMLASEKANNKRLRQRIIELKDIFDPTDAQRLDALEKAKSLEVILDSILAESERETSGEAESEAEATIQHLNDLLEDARRELDSKDSVITTLRDQLAEVSDDANDAKAIITSVRQSFGEYRGEMESEVASLRRKIAKNDRRHREALAAADRADAALSNEIDEAKAIIASNRLSFAGYKAEMEAKIAKLRSRKNALSSASRDADNVATEEARKFADLDSAYTAVLATCGSAATRIDRLEAQLASIRAERDELKVAKAEHDARLSTYVKMHVASCKAQEREVNLRIRIFQLEEELRAAEGDILLSKAALRQARRCGTSPVDPRETKGHEGKSHRPRRQHLVV